MSKLSRAEEDGIALADVVMRFAHRTYNAPRGRKIVQTCISRLTGRIDEIQPKKATPAYKKARYRKKKKKKTVKE